LGQKQSEGVNNPIQQTHNSSLTLRLSHTRRSTCSYMGNQCDQPASRQPVLGIRPSSAPSCSPTGSRSPSIASRKTERANSSGFTVLLPTDLSVHTLRRKPSLKAPASADQRRCCGSRALPHRRIYIDHLCDQRSVGVTNHQRQQSRRPTKTSGFALSPQSLGSNQHFVPTLPSAKGDRPVRPNKNSAREKVFLRRIVRPALNY